MTYTMAIGCFMLESFLRNNPWGLWTGALFLHYFFEVLPKSPYHFSESVLCLDSTKLFWQRFGDELWMNLKEIALLGEIVFEEALIFVCICIFGDHFRVNFCLDFLKYCCIKIKILHQKLFHSIVKLCSKKAEL